MKIRLFIVKIIRKITQIICPHPRKFNTKNSKRVNFIGNYCILCGKLLSNK